MNSFCKTKYAGRGATEGGGVKGGGGGPRYQSTHPVLRNLQLA